MGTQGREIRVPSKKRIARKADAAPQASRGHLPAHFLAGDIGGLHDRLHLLHLGLCSLLDFAEDGVGVNEVDLQAVHRSVLQALEDTERMRRFIEDGPREEGTMTEAPLNKSAKARLADGLSRAVDEFCPGGARTQGELDEIITALANAIGDKCASWIAHTVPIGGRLPDRSEVPDEAKDRWTDIAIRIKSEVLLAVLRVSREERKKLWEEDTSA